MKKISILGSTGSIGRQTLDIINKDEIEVVALACGKNIDLLSKQIERFAPQIVSVEREEDAKALETKYPNLEVFWGEEGLNAVAECDADLMINAIMGMVGLEPTYKAIISGKDIALANKETMVAGGNLVKKAAFENNVKIYPVDTEHSAIYQCLLSKGPNSKPRKLILTASGGPFFGKTRDELEKVTANEALIHPNWSMGEKITIDSATMMNKGLEIIEAVHLFDIDESKIEVLIHPQSIVHSMVEFCDGAIMAQLGVVDTAIAIQYSLTTPERKDPINEFLTYEKIKKLEFFKPDTDTFDAIDICRESIRRGGLYPASLNAANEVANLYFRQNKISFTEISTLSASAMDKTENIEDFKLLDVLTADRKAREFVKEEVEKSL